MVEVSVEDMLAPTAVQVDVLDDAGFVQQVEQAGEGFLDPAAAEFGAEVVVGIDGGETGPGDVGSVGDQPGSGVVIAQEHGSILRVMTGAGDGCLAPTAGSFSTINGDILADLQRKAIPQQDGTPVQNFLPCYNGLK